MAKQPKRHVVHRSLKICSSYDTIVPEELIKAREDRLAIIPEEFHKTFCFELDSYYESYDPNTYYGLFMKWQEFEDDKELAARLKREAEQLEASEKRERQEFERLSKKFSK